MSRSFPNGSSNRLEIGDVGPAEPAGAFSIAAWVRLAAAQAATIAAKWQNSTNRSWLFDFPNSTTLAFNILGANSTGYGASKTGVTANVWLHCAGVFTGPSGTIAAWLNGVSSSVTNVGNTTIRNSSIGTMLGARLDGPNPMNGLIADFAMWHTALTAAEIGALAKGVSSLRVRPGSLQKNCAPLWGVAYPEIDLSTGDNDWMQVGTVAAGSHAPVGCPFPV